MLIKTRSATIKIRQLVQPTVLSFANHFSLSNTSSNPECSNWSSLEPDRLDKPRAMLISEGPQTRMILNFKR
jgi:hypothetical protein